MIRAKYRRAGFSAARPESVEKFDIRTEAFCGAITEFLDENFRGCFRLEAAALGNETIRIAPEIFAFLLRRVFEKVYGRAMLLLTLKESEKALILSLDFDLSLLSEQELYDLSPIARSAGAEITLRRGGIDLLLEKRWVDRLKVYARDAWDPLPLALGKIFFGKR